MSNTAIQNNPIYIDLTQAARESGWTVDGSVAYHSSCNDGNLYIINYPLTIGQTYRYTYEVLTVSSGYVQAFLGTASGAMVSAVGLVDETVVADGAQLYLFSNGTLSIDNFSIEVVDARTDPYQENTIAYSEKQNKWVSFYSYIPENAFSIFTRVYSFYNGGAYVHESGLNDRCNFYGVQYPTTIVFTTNQQPSISKTYHGINYQANQLLTTSPSGIITANGQVSNLQAEDFIQADYGGGVVVYSTEGLFNASFLRDMTDGDIINGQQLQGNWCQITLQNTMSPSSVLELFTTEVIYVHSYQNIR